MRMGKWKKGNGGPKIVEVLEGALHALSTTSATPEELDKIRELLDGMRASPALGMPRADAAWHVPPLAARQPPQPRIATYSQGMHGFGHIRRNATIAHALRESGMNPVILMVAEAWQAGAIPLPEGCDCVTLPGLREGRDGALNARSLALPDKELIALRSRVIHNTLQNFQPDVLLVDHLPLGAGGELRLTLKSIRKDSSTRCVLGLREVLQDPETVLRQWSADGVIDALHEYYDAIWIYGDPAVFDPVCEYAVFKGLESKIRFTGYLDQCPRLAFAGAQATQPLANVAPSPAQLALCVVGGGVDGYALAEAFVAAELPDNMTGLVVTGPYMPAESRRRLLERAHPRCDVLEFLPDPVALIKRADRIVAMGGYNTICEVLSFEKHALIVPRVHETEQWIRAQRLRALGLVDVLHPDHLTPQALSEWLARDLGAPPASRSRIDVGGLNRLPGLLEELLFSAPARSNGSNGSNGSAPSWLK